MLKILYKSVYILQINSIQFIFTGTTWSLCLAIFLAHMHKFVSSPTVAVSAKVIRREHLPPATVAWKIAAYVLLWCW
uniref:Uncharacterized protein n=1 Tax=Triticum urartu TaxID=4572 RepID=A0A8R7TLW3_TRIUA